MSPPASNNLSELVYKINNYFHNHPTTFPPAWKLNVLIKYCNSPVFKNNSWSHESSYLSLDYNRELISARQAYSRCDVWLPIEWAMKLK